MKLLLSFAFSLSVLFAFGQWDEEPMTGLHQSVGIYDQSTFGILEANGSKLTWDGGESFLEYDLVDLSDNPLLGFIPTDLEYVDAQTLLCSGYYLGNEFEGILKSTNGGQNWEYTFANTVPGGNVQINDMHLAGNNTVYAVGRNEQLLKSTNNGDSWFPLGSVGASEYLQVSAWDVNNLAIATSDGILISTNGGETWDFTATGQPVIGINYRDASSLLACSYGNEVYYTADGGQNWETNSTQFSVQSDVVHVENDTWLMAAGAGYYISDNNGINWYQQITPADGVNSYALVTKAGLFLGRSTNRFIWTNSLAPVPVNYVRFDDLDAPTSVCVGETPLTLTIGNHGANEITSLDIDVFINGSYSETVTWNGTIPIGVFDMEIDLVVNVLLNGTTVPYELQIVSVNGTANGYSAWDSQSINLVPNAFTGDFLIGPNGDYANLQEFQAATVNQDLCADLRLRLEDGSYPGQALGFDPNEFSVIIEGENGIDSQVEIIGNLTVSGFENSGERELLIRNIDIIDATANQSQLLYVLGAQKVILENVNITCDPGITTVAVRCSDANCLFISDCELVSNVRAIRMDDGNTFLDSLVLNQVNIVTTAEAVLVENNINYVSIEDCYIETTSQVIEMMSTDFLYMRNNNFVKNNAPGPMVEAMGAYNASIEESSIVIENNVFHSQEGYFINGSGNILIRNNTFYCPEVTSGSYPSILMSNSNFTNQQIYIYNNIFELGGGRIGPFFNYENEWIDAICDFNIYHSTYDDLWLLGEEITPEMQLATWQETSGYDLNSIIGEVDFDSEITGMPLATANNTAIMNLSPLPAPELDKAGNIRQGPLTDLGPFELNLFGFDLGIFEIFTTTGCLGTSDLYVVVGNVGGTEITSFDLEWFVDENFQGTLNVSEVYPYLATDTLFLGSYTFETSGTYTLSAMLANVNGTQDGNPENDSASVDHTANFSAELHIGSGQEFASLTEAFGHLETNGMCGPIEFILHPGVHEASFTIFTFPENLDNHLLTIRSSTGNPEDVVIDTYAFGMRMRAYLHVKFEDVTIQSQGEACLQMMDELLSLEINNCLLNAIVYTNELDDWLPIEYIKITNCTYTNTTSNVSVFRNFGNSRLQHFLFENNVTQFEGEVFSGEVDVTNADLIEIRNNVLTGVNSQVITISNTASSIVENNQISITSDQGIRLQDLESGTHLIRNNFVQSFTDLGTGLSITSSPQGDCMVYHNTFRGLDRGASFSLANVEAFNNIFEGANTPVYLYSETAEEIVLDGNIYSAAESQNAFQINQDEMSLADFQTTYQQDLNSIQHVVAYTNEVGYQTSDTFVDGQFGNVAIGGLADLDIEGNPRDSNDPDVGCYEFGVIPIDLDIQVNQINIPVNICGELIDFSVEFTNTGLDPVTLFDFSLAFGDEVSVQTWEGSLATGESTLVEFTEMEIPQIEGVEISVALLSVNGQNDENQSNDSLWTEISGHPLSGLVFVGNSPQAQFQNLNAFFEYMHEYGSCDDLTAMILPGVYNWNVTGTGVTFASHERLIVSLGQDPQSVIIESTGSAMSLNGAGGFTFEDLTFISSGEAVSLETFSQRNIFSNCRFESDGPFSFIGSNSHDLEFIDCTFEGGVSLFECLDLEMYNCEITGGLYIHDCGGPIVFGNHVQSGSGIDYAYGIHLKDDNELAVIENNIITGNFENGILVEGNCNCDDQRWIVNNIIDHTGLGAAVYMNDTEHLNFFHNTVVSEVGPAYDSWSTTNQVFIDNNILVSEQSFALSTLFQASGFGVDNNILYSGVGTPLEDYESVEEYNNDTQANADNNVEADPMLTPVSFNVSNPEAQYMGKPIPDVPLDLNGNLRSQSTPMSGAIETLYEEPLPGDINGDGVIDTSDLLDVLGNFGCTVDCGGADINGDGVVNIADLLIILQGFSG